MTPNEKDAIFIEMLEVLEKILLEKILENNVTNYCPVCDRELYLYPHKEWCWWEKTIEVIKKARGEE